MIEFIIIYAFFYGNKYVYMREKSLHVRTLLGLRISAFLNIETLAVCIQGKLSYLPHSRILKVFTCTQSFNKIAYIRVTLEILAIIRDCVKSLQSYMNSKIANVYLSHSLKKKISQGGRQLAADPTCLHSNPEQLAHRCCHPKCP